MSLHSPQPDGADELFCACSSGWCRIGGTNTNTCQSPHSYRGTFKDSEDKITVNITRLGGGFGRRLKFDYVLEAAELSSIIKQPVKVIWSREDDMTGGSYRPAVRYRFEAALDQKGNLVGYKLRGVGINPNNPTREDNFPFRCS